MNKFTLVAILSLFFICSCRSTGTSEISNLSSVEKKLDVSSKPSKEEVVSLYGTPNTTFYKDNLEVLEYKYIIVKNSPLGYFPIVGMFFDRTYKANYLYAYFDKDGNLVKFDTVGVEGDYPIED